MIKFVIIGICLLALNFANCAEDRYLSLPDKKKCENRFMEAKYEGKNFFFSGNDPELKDQKLDWLDSRNECRKRCMETISFKDQKKFDFFKSYIAKNNISFIWTSGRLCDFDGCEGRWDLLPKIIKGWLWSADQTQISDTDKIPKGWDYQPWSKTGHLKKPQPDNAEYYLSQTRESCLGILNNQYNDSVAWHDIACYHKTRFICEDSDLLLEDVKHQDENKVQIEAEVPTTSKTTIETSPQARSTTIDTASRRKSTTTEISNVENTSTTSAQITTFERKSTKSSTVPQRRRRTRKTIAKETSTTISTTTQPPPTESTPEKNEISYDSLPESSIVEKATEIEVEETTLPLETSTASTTTSTTVSQGTRRFPLRRRKKQRTTKKET